MLLRSIKNNNSGVSSLGRWGYTRYQGSHHRGGGAIQDTGDLITWEVGLYKIPGVSSPGRWGFTRYRWSYHLGGGAIQDTRGLITGEVGLYKIPGVSSLGKWGYTRYQGSHYREMGLYKIPGVLSLGRWGYTSYQGSHHRGDRAIQDTRALITGEGAIQDTRGLITGEVGLYKIPGVSSLGRWDYTRYQGSHHWGGGTIQDTRGLITGEVGLYKIPGVSSPGRWAIQDTRAIINFVLNLADIADLFFHVKKGYAQSAKIMKLKTKHICYLVALFIIHYVNSFL